MDVFFKGLLVGTAAGVGVGFFAGYFLASRYELVTEDESVAEEPKEVVGATGHDQEAFERLVEEIDEKNPEHDEDEFGAFMESYGAHPEEMDTIDPHVITKDQYENEAACLDKIRLIFYPDYDLLVTEEEEMVDSPQRMLGENVIAFMEDTFENNGHQTVYVRNERFGADYEVELCTKLQADGWIRDYLEGMDA